MHLSPKKTDTSKDLCSFLEMTSGETIATSQPSCDFGHQVLPPVSKSGAHLSQNGVVSALPCPYHEKPHLEYHGEAF